MLRFTLGALGLITILALAACSPVQESCVEFCTAETTEWSGCDDDGTSILFFPVANTDLPERDQYIGLAKPAYIYADNQTLNSILNELSDRELLEAEAFQHITTEGTLNRIAMPVPFLPYITETITNIVFESVDGAVLIKNPYTGGDITLNGVDYVKFKNSTLLAVPPAARQ